MNPCERHDDELIACALRGELANVELAQHVATCAACAARWNRLARSARALASLPRQLAPRELEGRVAAAPHAGHREDRAVAAVRALARRAPPAELSDAVRSVVGAGGRAPEILWRRLLDELADPGRSTARRAIARLRRLAAPPELARRLSNALGSSQEGSRRRRWTRGAVVLALAACALLIVRLGGGPDGDPDASRGRPVGAIEFRRVETLAELDPLARSLFDDLSGGASLALRDR